MISHRLILKWSTSNPWLPSTHKQNNVERVIRGIHLHVACNMTQFVSSYLPTKCTKKQVSLYVSPHNRRQANIHTVMLGIKKAAILQTIFADDEMHVREKGLFIFWFKFYWMVFLGVQLSKSQHWFQQWLHAQFVDGLVQDYGISSALALEIMHSCTEP